MALVRFPAPYTMAARKVERAGDEQLWRLCGEEATKRFAAGYGWGARLRSGKWLMDDWVADGLFRKGSVILLAGESGIGKTWLLRDLVLSLARGDRWLGRYECLAGPSIYCMGEDDLDQTTRRDVCLLLGRDVSVPRFLQEKGDLLTGIDGRADSTSYPYLLSSLEWRRRAEDFLQGAPSVGARPLAWVFDPLATMVRDADTGGEDLKTSIKWCSWLAKATEGIVVLAHHLRKRTGTNDSLRDRIRGDSNLFNLVDDVLAGEADEDDPSVLKIYHLKSKTTEASSAVKPAFLVRRVIEQVTPEEEQGLFQALSVDPSTVKPGIIFRVRHVVFQREEAPPVVAGSYTQATIGSGDTRARPEFHFEALRIINETREGISATALIDKLRENGWRVGSVQMQGWLKESVEECLIGVTQKRPAGRGRPYLAYTPIANSPGS